MGVGYCGVCKTNNAYSKVSEHVSVCTNCGRRRIRQNKHNKQKWRDSEAELLKSKDQAEGKSDRIDERNASL